MGEGPGETGVNRTDLCLQKFMVEVQVLQSREIQEASGSLGVRLCGLEEGALLRSFSKGCLKSAVRYVSCT